MIIDDPEYHRKILTRLNRGESRHSVARTVFYGKKGELHQAYREGQEDQLGALGLVVNAIVLWNTRHMAKAIEELRKTGMAISDVAIPRLAPLGSDHIMFCLMFGVTVCAANPDKVELTKINEQIWVHTSYFNYMGDLIPSHGLLAITNAGIVLVDTPWNNDQTKELLKMVKDKFDQPIKLAVFSHWHQDRIGGIDTLIAERIKTASTALTAELAVKAGFQKPQTTINPKSEVFKVGDLSFETYYPGPGHSMDNIVVYFPKTRVLYGGCLVLSSG